MKKITELTENQVFTFGSNASGFHGAGSAGFAFHGDSGNSWRTNPLFQKAKQALDAKRWGKAFNPHDLIGNWAVLGENGLMQGNKGKSYGIITTEKPGEQGCVNDAFLQNEMEKLILCAERNPNLQFLCVNFGVSRAHGGFSWWSPKELKAIWEKALWEKATPHKGGNVPPNLHEPDWAKEPSKPAPDLNLWATPKSPDLDMG